MRRLSLWLRRHPIVGDSVTALLIAVLSLGELGAGFAHHFPLFFWLTGLLMIAPVVVRRRWPVASAYVIALGAVVQLCTEPGIGKPDAVPVRTSDVALAIALYTLVVYADRRTSLIYAAVLVTGVGVDLALAYDVDSRGPTFALSIGAAAVFGFAWVLGEFVGARKAYHSEVEARLRLLETERDQQATIAVAAERTRIARELHDVVAHAVSVMVVQADGAGYAIHSDPELATKAVRTISDTGREALMELRRLLDVLRSDGDEHGSRTPQPGLSGLPELADKFRAVGLPVELTVRGDVTDLPAAVELGAYRIVQEALTNAFKHAGDGASAAVRVERVGGLVEVEVCDHGGQGDGPRLASVSGGNGLIGMRERASVLGGTLTAGWADGGGWRVRGTFPIRAPHDTATG